MARCGAVRLRAAAGRSVRAARGTAESAPGWPPAPRRHHRHRPLLGFCRPWLSPRNMEARIPICKGKSVSGVRLRVLPSLPGCSAPEGLQGTSVVWAGGLVPTPAVDLEGYGPTPVTAGGEGGLSPSEECMEWTRRPCGLCVT